MEGKGIHQQITSGFYIFTFHFMDCSMVGSRGGLGMGQEKVTAAPWKYSESIFFSVVYNLKHSKERQTFSRRTKEGCGFFFSFFSSKFKSCQQQFGLGIMAVLEFLSKHNSETLNFIYSDTRTRTGRVQETTAIVPNPVAQSNWWLYSS